MDVKAKILRQALLWNYDFYVLWCI